MSKRTKVGLGLLASLTAVGLLVLRPSEPIRANNHPNSDQVKIGLAVAPLPLRYKSKDRDLVGLGSYLVNVAGDCNGCHSVNEFAPGGDPYQGEPKIINKATYLLGGQSFGPFVSRNLRPEKPTGLPAGRTYGQFLAVIRHGTDFDHPGELLQVMPWPSYQNLTESDIRAIYTYLSALPAVAPPD